MPKPLPRPSTLYYLSLCPGYRPDQSDSADTTDADRGTLLHKCVETRDLENAENEFDRSQVEKAIALCDDIIARLPQEPAPRIFSEVRLRSPLFPKGGTLDRLILSVNPRSQLEADLIDWKFGFNPVLPPGENAQQLAYVSLLFEALPELARIRAHLVFPGLNLHARHEFTPRDMPTIVASLRAVASRAQNPDPRDYRPGAACTYCALCSSCPAILRDASPTLTSLVNNILAPATPEPSASINLFTKPVLTMDNDELRKARTIAVAGIDLLEGARKAIDKEIMDRGAEIFGYRIQKRQGAWTVEDLGGLLAFLRDECPEVFSNETPEGVSNTLTLLSDTEPSVPITRFFPALHARFAAEPDKTPLRYQGLTVTQLREAVLSDLQSFQREGLQIVKQGASSTFVVKAAKMEYARIFTGPETMDAVEAAATEDT